MRRILFAALALAVLTGGCGRGTPGGSGREARLLLDSPPKALHVGIYLAKSRGYADAEGTPMRILLPDGPGPAALAGGEADVAVMEIHDLARGREAGEDLVGVMALVQRPGPDASPERVDGLDYPEFVLVATRATLDDRERDVRAVIRALQRGYEEVAVDPESAVSVMADAQPGLDREQLARDLDRIGDRFEAGVSDYGLLVRERLEEWGKRAREQQLIDAPLDVGQAFDFTLVDASDR